MTTLTRSIIVHGLQTRSLLCYYHSGLSEQQTCLESGQFGVFKDFRTFISREPTHKTCNSCHCLIARQGLLVLGTLQSLS